jgi:hypothetical protein
MQRVGVHWSTGVHLEGAAEHRVCQVFASAVPVTYSGIAASVWEPFARLVLDAAYDATLCVSTVLAWKRKARVTVYLTMLGGGAFGNERLWIREAMQRALDKHRDAPLDVVLVHYGSRDAYYDLSV